MRWCESVYATLRMSARADDWWRCVGGMRDPMTASRAIGQTVGLWWESRRGQGPVRFGLCRFVGRPLGPSDERKPIMLPRARMNVLMYCESTCRTCTLHRA